MSRFCLLLIALMSLVHGPGSMAVARPDFAGFHPEESARNLSGAFEPMLEYADVAPVWSEVTVSPPSIRLHFLYPQDFTLYRRVYGEPDWGQPVEMSTGGQASWLDTDVQAGVLYEYGIQSAANGQGNSAIEAFGFITTGIRVDRAGQRGRLLLVLASDIIEPLRDAVSRLIGDLMGDGWKVETLVAPRFMNNSFAADNDKSYGLHGHAAASRLRDRIRAFHADAPEETRMVYLLGHTPVALSGTRVSHPDGHGDRGSYPTDHYFSDLDGRWPDVLPGNPTRSMRAPLALPNVPGDGLFDPNSIPGDIELAIGRVDAFEASQDGLSDLHQERAIRHLGNYLDKAHRYRHGIPFEIPLAEEPLQPGRKAVLRDGNGGQDGAAKQAADLVAIFGPAYMEKVLLSTPSPVPPVRNRDTQATINGGPYLYYGQDSQGPFLNDNGARAVHRYGMQSWWGDLMLNSLARINTMSAENMCLTWLYTGRFVKELLLHPLGTGETFGEVLRLSANDNPQSYLTGFASWRETTFLRMLMADPALRLFTVPPIRNLTAVESAARVALQWDPPAGLEAFVEYRVYRAADRFGDFSEIARGLTEPAFMDAEAPPGPKAYQVRAVHQVESGSGTFLNNAQGQFVETGLHLSTVLLPPFPLGEASAFQLQAEGASGPVSWRISSGALPTGMALSADGWISGTPQIPGPFRFIVEATDDTGYPARRTLEAFVDAAFTEIIHLDLRARGGLGSEDRTQMQRSVTIIGDPLPDPIKGWHFDGSGDALRVHDMSHPQWPDFHFHADPGSSHGFAMAAAFRSPPGGSGGVLLSRSLNLDPDPEANRNQYTLRLLPDGRLEGIVGTRSIHSEPGYHDGQWHHAVLTTGTDRRIQLFIDGALVADAPPASGSHPGDLLIGARWEGSPDGAVTESFVGRIADVRVWNTRVSAGEAKALAILSAGKENLHPPRIDGLPAEILVNDPSPQSFPFTVTEPDGEPLHLRVHGTGSPGPVRYAEVLPAPGGYELLLELDPDVKGQHNLTVSADDGWPGNLARHILTIRAPGSADDTLTVARNAVIEFDPLENDVAPDGETLLLGGLVGQPSAGYAERDGGIIRFFPPVYWEEPVTLEYETIIESFGEGYLAEVTLVPESVPFARDDTFAVDPDNPTDLYPLANDSDPADGRLELVLMEQPEAGRLFRTGNRLTFHPPASGLPQRQSVSYRIRNDRGFHGTGLLTLVRDTGPEGPMLHLELNEKAGRTASNTGWLGPDADGAVLGSFQWIYAPDGGALHLNGSNTVLELPARHELDLNPAQDSFTVILGLLLPIGSPGVGETGTLLAREAPGNKGLRLAITDVVSDTDSDLELSFNNHRWTTRTTPPESPWQATTPGSWRSLDQDVRDIEWKVLTLIHDAEARETRLYLDIFLVAVIDTSRAEIGFSDPEAGWIFGARPDGEDRFEGYLANVRIFNYAIDPATVPEYLEEMGQDRLDMHPVVLPPYFNLPPGSKVARGQTLTFHPRVEDPDTPHGEVRYHINQRDGSNQVFTGPFDITVPASGTLSLYINTVQMRDGDTLHPTVSPMLWMDYPVGSETVPAQTLGFSSSPLITGIEAGRPFSRELGATAAMPPLRRALVGQGLPDGVQFDPATGTLSGEVAAPGQYAFTVVISDDSDSMPVRQRFQLNVSPPDRDRDSLPDDWEEAYEADLDPGKDPDQDGRSNRLEFALGSHPLRADTLPPARDLSWTRSWQSGGPSDQLTFRLRWRSGEAAPGMRFDFSSDLESWDRLPAHQRILMENDGEFEVWELQVPVDRSGNTFLRMDAQ